MDWYISVGSNTVLRVECGVVLLILDVCSIDVLGIAGWSRLSRLVLAQVRSWEHSLTCAAISLPPAGLDASLVIQPVSIHGLLGLRCLGRTMSGLSGLLTNSTPGISSHFLCHPTTNQNFHKPPLPRSGPAFSLSFLLLQSFRSRCLVSAHEPMDMELELVRPSSRSPPPSRSILLSPLKPPCAAAAAAAAACC